MCWLSLSSTDRMLQVEFIRSCLSHPCSYTVMERGPHFLFLTLWGAVAVSCQGAVGGEGGVLIGQSQSAQPAPRETFQTVRHQGGALVWSSLGAVSYGLGLHVGCSGSPDQRHCAWCTDVCTHRGQKKECKVMSSPPPAHRLEILCKNIQERAWPQEGGFRWQCPITAVVKGSPPHFIKWRQWGR